MGKSFFFFHGVALSGNGKDKYITTGDHFRVDGGTKESHQHMVELTQGVTREVAKNPEISVEEVDRIIQEVVKKVGIPSRLR